MEFTWNWSCWCNQLREELQFKTQIVSRARAMIDKIGQGGGDGQVSDHLPWSGIIKSIDKRFFKLSSNHVQLFIIHGQESSKALIRDLNYHPIMFIFHGQESSSTLTRHLDYHRIMFIVGEQKSPKAELTLSLKSFHCKLNLSLKFATLST